MARLFKKSLFLIANPMLVIPVVFAFHSSNWRFSLAGRGPQGRQARTTTLFELSSNLESSREYSLVASLSGDREIKRIHFVGLGSQDQSWTVDELNQGVTIEAPRGEFSGPQGQFGVIRAQGFSPSQGGELDLDFPGTLERGVITRARLRVNFDAGKWVVYPVSDRSLRAAWSEGLNNHSIVVN